jgi:hypothetical protein
MQNGETPLNGFVNLSAMQQTTYVLARILEGTSKADIVTLCNDHERLVSACIDFLKQLKWLKESNEDPVSSDVTPEGIGGITRYLQ